MYRMTTNFSILGRRHRYIRPQRIEVDAGDKGFRVGMFGRHISVSGAGYIPFRYGDESVVHD